MRVERRIKQPSKLQKPKAERFWDDRTRKKHIKVGDSLLALEAKLAAIKPRQEATC